MPRHDQNWTVGYGMEDYLNQTEKRLGNEERRPTIHGPADILGAGFAGGALATPMSDFNDRQFWVNGIWYAPAGTLNGPNGTVTIGGTPYDYDTTAEGKDCLVLSMAALRLSDPDHGSSIEELRVTQVAMILNFSPDGGSTSGYIAYRWLRLLSSLNDADYGDWELVRKEAH